MIPIDATKNFLQTLNQIKINLEKGNFDSAIASYTKLRSYFKQLNKEKKSEFQQHYDIIVNKLLLYFYAVEALTLAKSNSLSNLDDILARINYLKHIIANDIPKKLLEFVQNKEKEVHYHKIYWGNRQSFVELYKKIIKLAQEKDLTTALENFHQLEVHYNVLVQYEDYENRLELYKRVTQLRNLLSSIFSHPILPKLVQPKKSKINTVKINLRPTNAQNHFEKIKTALKKDDYLNATKVYHKI